ncbi:MAG: hypothetical protein MUD14_26730 [Hydrococcus sp. Prado102]|jgi:hypothetical protein|nr:hypothetical protein [Hydrococcus sp. Prado102]
MLSAIKNTTFIRNYAIAIVSVTMMSVALTDLYNQPSRIGQQNKLDSFSRVVSAGLVSQSQKVVYR